MIRSTIRKDEYEEIYRLLDTVSPLPCDCGTLCGAVCCGTEEESAEQDSYEMGIYLLPGEEKVHSKKESWLLWSEERAEDYDFPDSWKGKVFFVRCKTPPHCPREKRPIQCRTFPLTPHFDEDGCLVLILNDVDLPYRCPLIEEEVTLNPDFLEITFSCWERLVRDPLIRDLVMMDSRDRYGSVAEPDFVYDPR